MNLLIISTISIISICLAILFMVLWIRERRHANSIEVVAYGLRSEDDSTENTKTSLSMLESEYDAAMDKLCEMGEIERDNWGRWVWSKTGKQLSDA